MELIKQLNRIQRELKAPKNNKNAFGGYYYRSCEDILEAVKPLLDELILTLTDDIIVLGVENSGFEVKTKEYNDKAKEWHEQIRIAGGARYYVKATATLTDGKDKIEVSAFAREAETKKGMDESQVTGAASSYARKYALNGLFAIDDERDADTKDNRPQQPAQRPQTYQRPQQRPANNITL
jgi:hypothetical protein